MIAVDISYRPFDILRWTRTINAKLPARWSELTQEQMARVPDLQSEKLDDDKAIALFLGVHRAIARKLDSYHKFCILRNLKYLFSIEPLDKFLIKEISGLRAPDDRLRGVTFGAFIFADSYFDSYLHGKKEDLDKFIASLYTGECGFSEKLIEVNAGIIRKESRFLREAIGVNYALIREWLARVYPNCFEKPEPGSKKKNQKGWVAVFDAVVGNDIVNQDRYALLPVNQVLRYLNERTKNYYKNGSKV